MAIYTTAQIENAKKAYNEFLQYRSVESYEPEFIGYAAAEQRCESHNKIVKGILEGNKELTKEWKLFFLNEEVKAANKKAANKAKLTANKEASTDILAPVKALKIKGDFDKWLNNSSNPFRKEYFSKKYTTESVSAFLKTL